MIITDLFGSLQDLIYICGEKDKNDTRINSHK